MQKRIISKENKEEFNNTINGSNKLFWMKMGCLIDIIGTMGLSMLIIYSPFLKNIIIFYFLLYLLLVFIIIGAEFIGTYYGALEQYVLNQKEKKKISYYN